MKAFGVRLTAGALTILFGAYAAALAQKDKQNDSETWSADAPSLGEPASPIADIGGDSWLSQPTAGDETESNPVQLVQHVAPQSQPAADLPQNFEFDESQLESQADNDGDQPETNASDVPVPDWTRMPQEPEPQDVHANAPAMTLPNGIAAELPELEIARGPSIEFAPDPQSEPFPSDGPATASLGNPNNALRDGASDGNMLRQSAADAPPSPDQWSNESPQAQLQSQAALEQQAPFEGFPVPFVPEAQANQLPNQLPGTPTPNQFFEPQPDGNPNFSAQEMAQPENESAYQPAAYQQSPSYQQQGENISVDPSITIDAPGDRRLEGAQAPSVVIQKRAPSEVKVGQPATFVIHVQNVGSVEALDVVVQDKVPSGMRLIDASPRPMQQGNDLVWQLGSMPAGDERTVTLQLVPEQEGELGSVARVSFEAAASVRTIATRPELKIVQRAPESVLIGQQLEIELEVSNPGTGEATNVVLQEDVPQGLEHPKGRQLDNALGNLAPGELRRQVLRMRAVEPGIVQNTIRLTADDGLVSEHTVNVQVIAPELKVDLEGPTRRFLERQATYFVHIGNVGTADATNVEVLVQLDRGFTFVSTENEGQYDPSRHTVHWSLAQMPAGGTGKVALTLLPVQEGEQAIRLDARADMGIVAKNERRLSVEGFSELSFSITNPGGPIELGSETTYEIKVNNSGSKADSNVRVGVELPPGLKLLSADGDAGTDGRGRIQFQPKSSLPPGSEQAYRIRVQGVAPGTHIVKAVVISDLATTPVTKEESTVVYADQ